MPPPVTPPERALEAPTWLMLAGVYVSWLALTAGYAAGMVPVVLVPLLAGVIIACHGSLQHEAVHHHPTRHGWLNAILVAPSLWLWLPYAIYRESHMAHHRSEAISDPLLDPESYYVTEESWRGLDPVRRGFLWCHQTLLGRLVLGPPLAVARLVSAQLGRLARGDFGHLKAWAQHVLALAPVLAWLAYVGVGLADYILLFAYPGLALTLLRSFAEHHRRPGHTSVVESRWVGGVLFLNNNLHVVHHDEPALPWYDIPARYRRHPPDAPTYRGYREVVRRFLLVPRDQPWHP